MANDNGEKLKPIICHFGIGIRNKIGDIDLPIPFVEIDDRLYSIEQARDVSERINHFADMAEKSK